MFILDFFIENEPFGSKDLSVYWHAAKRFLDGRDPYAIGDDPGPPFFGSPSFLLLMSLLGKYDLGTASIVLVVINSILLLTIYGISRKHLFGPAPANSRGWRRLAPLVLVVSFLPALQSIVIGQVAIISTFVLTLLLAGFKAGLRISPLTRMGSYLSGALFAFTIVKPHQLVIVYLYLALLALFRKQRPIFFGMCAGATILLALPLLSDARLYTRYFEVALDAGSWMTPTLGAWLMRLISTDSGWLRYLPLAIGGAYLLVRSRRLTGDLDELVFVVSMSLVCAPYLWTYDFSLLLPVVVALSGKQAQHPALATLPGGTITLLIAFNVGLWITAKHMEYSVWFPLAVFSLAIASYSTDRQSERTVSISSLPASGV